MAGVTAQQETKPFLCRYFHDGAEWALTIHAYNWMDAEARCRKLGLNLDGELIATMPIQVGLMAKAICAVRNFFRARPSIQ